MKSDRYEPRECEVCGQLYKPGKIDQRTCGSKECVHELRRRNALRWQRENSVARREHRKKHREPKQDTIVAIGYADRQRAETRDPEDGRKDKGGVMRWIILVLLMALCILMVICYALCVIAHDADERAERMYRKWKEEHNERERQISN